MLCKRKILTLMFHDGLGVVELLLPTRHTLEGGKKFNHSLIRNYDRKNVYTLSKKTQNLIRLDKEVLPWRFFRILFALCISFLHSAIFSCAEVIFCSAR